MGESDQEDVEINEKLFTPKMEVITEDEKKMIRDQVEEIKKEVSNNKVAIKRPKNIHKIIYKK